MPRPEPRRPALAALSVFECAGRHLSFTRAAQELHVTQGAVSRQIKLLEAALGKPLFRRLHRAVEFTTEGRRYHRAVSMALQHIAAATQEFAGSAPGSQVVIASTLAVATFWLMPRLAKLREQVPGLDVQVLATDTELEHLGGQFDVAIRFGTGRWKGQRATRLGGSAVFPVCSPDYLARIERPACAADLLGCALLHMEDDRWDWQDWPVWLRELGVPGPYPRPALRVNSYPLLIQAAVTGQGVALGWHPLVDAHLEVGTLVVPCEAKLTPPQGFYLTVAEDKALDADGRALCDWIVSEFRGADG